MFDVLDMGASGLTAQRTRMDIAAQNVAGANTTRNAAGEPIPFRRRYATLVEGRGPDSDAPGVHVADVLPDESPFQRRYEPGHVDANAEGYVLYPNVDIAIETVNAMEASRAYEANVNMMEVTKAMINASLRLIA